MVETGSPEQDPLEVLDELDLFDERHGRLHVGAAGVARRAAGVLGRGVLEPSSKQGVPGGQYGVSVTNSSGALGKFRYLLFDVVPTETDDPWGNTFFSEIDVVGKKATGN